VKAALREELEEGSLRWEGFTEKAIEFQWKSE